MNPLKVEFSKLNLSTLDKLKKLQEGGETNLMQELYDTFFETGATAILDMKRFAEAKNSAEIAKRAHNFKSGSYTIGADSVAKLCQRLEDTQKKGQSQDVNVDAMIAQTEAEFNEVIAQLKLYIQGE